MPSSTVRRFADPDDYAAAIRQGNVELAVTQRGAFAAKLTRIDLHRVWLQRFEESLSRIKHVDGWGGRAILLFYTAPGTSALAGGLELGAADMLRPSPGRGFFFRSTGSSRYGAVSLPLEDFAAAAAAMTGTEVTAPRDAMLLTPPPAAMARLRRLHASAGWLAEEAPEIIADPDAARGFEQALIEAMVGCLDGGPRDKAPLARGQHEIVMRRFRRVLEENIEQPLYIPEICRAIGVAERSLRTCCQEHLGMSPKRYLVLRRMQLARRALREAKTTVTAVATRYGFWQLGRFAVAYGALFGETPSATLRRARLGDGALGVRSAGFA